MNWNRKRKDMRGRWRPRETKRQAILGREIRGAREDREACQEDAITTDRAIGKPPGVTIEILS